MRKLLFILILFLSSLVEFAYAMDASEGMQTESHIFVPNLKKADQLGHYLTDEILSKYKLDFGQKLTIEIVHFGDEFSIPKELTWLINHLKHIETQLHNNTVEIKVKIISPDEINKASEFIESQLNIKAKTTTDNFARQLFENNNTSQFNLQFKDPAKQKKIEYLQSEAKSFVSNLGIYSRKFFGIPRGTNWIMYKHSFTKRTPREHTVELGLAIVQAASLYGFNYQAVALKAAENPELILDPVAAATTVAAWKLFNGYIERANSAFHVQGIGWQPMHGFSINRAFFLTSAYVHSLIVGMTVQIAANGGVHNMNEHLIGHTALNSLLGLFNKALPMFLIAKHQRNLGQVTDSESLRHSKWKTIAYNTLFNVSFQGLKAAHLFQVDKYHLSSLFVALGVSGIAYEGFQFFKKGKTNIAEQSRANNSFQYYMERMKRTFNATPAPPPLFGSCQAVFQ